MFSKIKNKVIDAVVWAERELRGKTGREKRDAAVKKLDDLIVLPPFLEPFDGPIIGFLVDLVVDKLNTSLGHNFSDESVQEQAGLESLEAVETTIAESLDIPAGMLEGLSGAVLKEGA